MTAENQKKYDAKLKRLNDALDCKEPDMLSKSAPYFFGEGPGHELTQSKKMIIAGQPGAKIEDNSIHQHLEEETKRLLGEAMPGGGYIFRCSAGLDGGKVENVIAMFETVREYGKY